MENIVDTLRNSLKKGIVRFTFTKKDDSLRHAIGTRNLSVAGKHLGFDVPALKGGKENENAYYDLEKQAWRSFVPENVVSIEE